MFRETSHLIVPTERSPLLISTSPGWTRPKSRRNAELEDLLPKPRQNLHCIVFLGLAALSFLILLGTMAILIRLSHLNEDEVVAPFEILNMTSTTIPASVILDTN